MIQVKDIENAKHIALIATNDSFANASAIYSYILTLHKKVTLVQLGNVNVKFSFLPWYDKVRKTHPASADLHLEIGHETLEYFSFFQKNEININKKMATSLYASLMMRYDGFKSIETDGIVFATASELIKLQAEYKVCNDFLLHRVALSLFRLKAILFANMLLKEDARVAELYVSDKDFESSGASMQDAELVMKEALTLVNVKEVVLIKRDENNKIIKKL